MCRPHFSLLRRGRCQITSKLIQLIFDKLEALLSAQLPKISGKTKLAQAIRYALNRMPKARAYLSDGRLELDNNTAERTIRPIALNRKNALFAGHETGAQNWAILASLIETCKLNGIEPQGYLTSVLTAIVNGHKQSRIEELLPWKLNITNSP